jgi:hypothetical protein
MATVLPLNHQYVLNHCTSKLARSSSDVRHNYNNLFDANDQRARISEPWRFPIVDSFGSLPPGPEDQQLNRVTFVCPLGPDSDPADLAVIGSFHPLYQSISLEPVLFLNESTGYYACTLLVPKGQVHTYRFVINGAICNDFINPQSRKLTNGEIWSLFYTDGATELITFEPWQARLLERLTDHILPFRTSEGEQFLEFYYNYLDRQAKDARFPYAYRFDQSVGIVNFIDKLLSKQERHHLVSYTNCLQIIDRLLRTRNQYQEPFEMPRDMYSELYDQMFSGNVPDWPYATYGNPAFFLELLRRHAYTGAFSHPKYGGNAGAAGWDFLAGLAPFNWRQAVEAPLGTNTDYRG